MRRQQGFSYVVVMFLVAVLSLLSVRALRNTLTEERRAKEAELLATGIAYRNAIRAYYENAPGTGKVYPDSLEALLEDRRGTKIRKHLRKRFRDPITGSRDWGLVYLDGDQTQIVGVYCLSAQRPIKRNGFPDELGPFINAASYRDWKFVYKPR
jgi:type II secretory pathway pseudopilin PulG